MKPQTCLIPFLSAALVFTSCTSRIGSPPATRPIETANRTLQSEMTGTPSSSATSESIQDPASPGIPASEQVSPGGDPDLNALLLVTPVYPTGVITISPFLNADAGSYVLSPGEPVTLQWEGYPSGALRYQFLLLPHNGEPYQTIGIDQSPAEGVEVEWLVPENTAGDIYAVAIYENSQVSGAVFVGAIYASSRNGSTLAENVLKEFFRALSRGEYQAASNLYGGSYSILEQYNPDLDPANKTGLLERACQFNGFVCLPVQDVLSIEPNSTSSFIITVNFLTEEGVLLNLDGCCGETPSEEPQTAFTYRVAKDPEGHFLVMDLPVYIP